VREVKREGSGRGGKGKGREEEWEERREEGRNGEGPPHKKYFGPESPALTSRPDVLS